MAKKPREPKIAAAPTEYISKNKKEELDREARQTRLDIEQMDALEIPPQQGIENVITISEDGPGFEGGASVVGSMVSEGVGEDTDQLFEDIVSEQSTRTVLPRKSQGRPKGYKKVGGEWQHTEPQEPEVVTKTRTVRRVKEPKAESSNTGFAKRFSQRGQKLLVKSTKLVANFTDPPIEMTADEAYEIVEPLSSWLSRQPIIENPILRKAVDNFELGEVGLGLADYIGRVIREETQLINERRYREQVAVTEEYRRTSESRSQSVADSIQRNPRVRRQRQGAEGQESAPTIETNAVVNGESGTFISDQGAPVGFEKKIPEIPG